LIAPFNTAQADVRLGQLRKLFCEKKFFDCHGYDVASNRPFVIQSLSGTNYWLSSRPPGGNKQQDECSSNQVISPLTVFRKSIAKSQNKNL